MIDKELLNAKLINIESWSVRARRQIEAGNIANIMIATERIKQAADEIDTLIKEKDESVSYFDKVGGKVGINS